MNMSLLHSLSSSNSSRCRLMVIGCVLLLGKSLSVTASKSEFQSTTVSPPSTSRKNVDHGGSVLPFVYSWRGGAGAKKKLSTSTTNSDTPAYAMLGRAVSSRIESLLKKDEDDNGDPPEIADLIRAFRDMSQAQQTFKGLDGAAHEAYQRTHASSDTNDMLGVSGRALRTAARTGAVADALGACELCELASSSLSSTDNDEWCTDLNLLSSPNGTLANRQILLNLTNNDDGISCGGTNLQLLVLYEASYRGGAGLHHGGIEDLGSGGGGSKQKTHQAKGRILVVLGDRSVSLSRALKVLSKKPIHVRLSQSGHRPDDDTSSEAASVQPELYRAASALLLAVEPILRQHNESAIHFVGHSLAGGVASLAATILEGSIPLSDPKKKDKKNNKKKAKKQLLEDKTNHTEALPLQGFGKGRSSAVTLGAPPSMSANVRTDFVTSILYGDDIVGRACSESMERFYQRTRKALKKKGLFTRQLNRITDTISLATSSLKSHAHGSEGEEARLAIAGRAYLVRPRRLGSACSMHEIGGSQLMGGREALRAAVLWQLNDILLSKSFWKHHKLDSYIHGLDRVHLRGFEGDHDE